METSIWEDSPFDTPPGAPAAEIPSVVAVVVTSDPEERFDAVLASLATQDYPSLTVLVVDAGSGADLAPRIGAVLPDAFIRRLPDPVNFAVAANEALSAVEGANYLLFLADDVALAPDAIAHLVEEAVRSNAGIVGPKIVDADRRDVLLQIGLAADKLGVPAPLIEPGEIDHEQHDAVRDVFAVPHAAMLVRADLMAELRGFDAEFAMGIEEVDLCWRARLAGARVLVVPDAVVQRPAASLVGRFGPDPDRARADEPSHRLRMVLRNYSAWSLLRVLPQALLVTAFQAVALLVMGRAGRSWSVVRAWFANLGRLRTTWVERRAVQAQRGIPDTDVRSLQVRGFAYVRAFLSGQLDLGGRVETLSGASRDLAQNVTGGVRRPSIVFGAVLSTLVALGSRELIANGLPAVGGFLPWPDVGTLWREFGSAWRFVGVGSSGPAPPFLALAGTMSSLLFGATGMARTLLVVGAIPLGAYGAFRLMLPLARSVWPPLAAATAYAVVPLPRNAIAGGRLGPLVFYALAPFILERIFRASALAPFGATVDEAPARDPRKALFSLAALTAVSGAVFPAALALVPLMAAALFLASALAGERTAALRGLGASILAAVLAVALLFPWSVGLLVPTPDLGALGMVFRDRPTVVEVLLFDTGPARVGIAGLLLIVAAQPLVIGSGERLRWATRAWFLAMGGWFLAWIPSRIGWTGGVPPVEGPLVLAALGVSMAVGLGSGILREELQRAGLSWRQAVAVAGIGALALVAAPFAADSLDGRWNLPATDWRSSLAWMESETSDGGFRVLWVGDPDVLPADPSLLDDGTAFAVTRNGTGDALAHHPPPVEGATRQVADALEALVDRRTDRFGHMVAAHAIRYVAFPAAAWPGRISADDGPPISGLSAALAEQIDLAELAVDPGIRLYENRAWLPEAALVSGELAETVLAAGPGDAIEIDLAGARPVPGTPRSPDDVRVREEARDVVSGVLMLAEPFSSEWDATSGSALRPRHRIFGTTTGFVVEDVESVSVTLGGQWLRYGAVGVEVVIGGFLLVAWSRRHRLERRAIREHRRSLRDVRPRTTESPGAVRT